MKYSIIYNMWKHILILLIFISYNTKSQTNEIGLFLGGSLFHGDVGYNYAESAVLSSRPVFGFQIKRNFNYHFGINMSIHRGELYANDTYSSDPFRLQRNLHFKSKITEFALIAEFNFRPYMSREPEAEYNSTPFVFTGITKFYFNPQAQYNNDTWHYLRPLTTEGQNSDAYPYRELYELNGLSVPFGIGYKFNVYNFITININLSWRITFTDYLDDVSTTYVDASTLSELGAELADQSENNFPAGFQRGNPHDNDKYGFLGITILYSIKDPNKGCDNIIY